MGKGISVSGIYDLQRAPPHDGNRHDWVEQYRQTNTYHRTRGNQVQEDHRAPEAPRRTSHKKYFYEI